jgi:hypothetical protein
LFLLSHRVKAATSGTIKCHVTTCDYHVNITPNLVAISFPDNASILELMAVMPTEEKDGIPAYESFQRKQKEELPSLKDEAPLPDGGK